LSVTLFASGLDSEKDCCIPAMACQLALPWMATVVLLLALAAQPVQAQIYQLEQAPVPAPFSLTTHYVFYVNAQAIGAQASVEFRQLAAHKTPNGQQPPSGYKSLEVSILPFDKFWDLVNKEQFCSSAFHLMLREPELLPLSEIGVRTQEIPLGSVAETTVFPIKESGKYLLMLSNCGNYSEATLAGSVAVRSAHGYLPTYEANAMRIAGWYTVIYTAIFVAWTGAMVRYFKSLFYIQKGIFAIILTCVLEALFTWLDHQDWNANGNRRDSLFLSSLVFYTLKYVLSWRLMLLAALGAGVVFEDLDLKTSVVFFIASFLFMIQSCTWRLIMSFRHSHALDSTLLLLVTFPGILIYAGMFGWSFMLLSSMVTRVTEQKQEELAAIFRKVKVILIVGFVLSTINASVQVVDIAKTLFSWEHAWLAVDGSPQLSFLGVLVAMMVVWRPSESSWKFGYQVHTDVAEEEDADVDHIQLDASKPKAEKANMVAPEAIGAPEKEIREGQDGENLL